MDPLLTIGYGILTVFAVLSILTMSIWLIGLAFRNKNQDNEKTEFSLDSIRKVVIAVSAVSAYENEVENLPEIRRASKNWKNSYRW